jgi:hypothetical protein
MRLWLLTASAAGLGLAVTFVACSTPNGNTCTAEGVGCATPDASTADGTSPDGAAEAGEDSSSTPDSSSAADTSTTPDSPPACDPAQDPATTPCLVTETYGVFVSTAGSDTTGDGSRTNPYATVGKGLTAAKAAGKREYVCAGTYAETVTVDAAHDGVNVYGGFACATWTYATSNLVKVAPSAPGVALLVSALTTGMTIEDVTFVAMTAAGAGASSVAVFANGASNVVLRRVKATAGDGAAGASGTSGASASNYNVGLVQSDPTIAGKTAMGEAGGLTQTCAGLCMNSTASTGGKGGGGDPAAPGNGNAGGPAIPANPTSFDNGAGGDGAGVMAIGAPCGSGDQGATAADATGGGAATTYGALSATGWTPSAGQAGAVGGPGQGGGGGGGGKNSATGGGGGGACGGCGGSGGGPGNGGGSSFAILSFNSTVSLDACTLVAGNGKNGGQGGAGQAGQLGGLGGAPAAQGIGCGGGLGGTGGAGSGGGGGTGGLSVAVAYSGTAPTQINGTTTSFGQPGTGGPGGAAGDVATASNAGQKGLDGVAVASQSF